MRVSCCVAASVIALVADLTAPAHAQTSYPERPIRLIVPYMARGATDLIARDIAAALKDPLGQTVVVENRPDAHGGSASTLVAGAEADGHTLLFADNDLAINPGFYRPGGFDPLRQLDAVCLVATTPLVLVASTRLKVDTLAQFVARARSMPGGLSFGSAGAGSVPHLAFAVFAAAAGIDAVHVAHQGGGQAIGDVAVGNVDATVAPMALARRTIAQGQTKGLAIAGPVRSALLPDLPTLRESGVVTADVELRYWWGIFAPAGLSQDTREKLGTAVAAALAQPGLRARLARLDVEPAYAGAPALAAMLANEVANWTKFIDAHDTVMHGLKPE